MSLRLLQRFGVVELHGLPSEELRRFGVPPGGAFDNESFAIANTLVSNPSITPVWELSMAQATFRAEADGLVAIVGAEVAVRELPRCKKSGCCCSVFAGTEFTVEAPRAGARVYVAWRSASFTSVGSLRLDSLPESVLECGVLRVVPGPQASLFDLRALSWPFKVSQTGNRVGIRLEPTIEAHKIELTSEPQCVGSIQISNDGTPIVIGPDGPTIGGYPKIAIVATCDIPRLAQLRPDDEIRFELITVADARRLAIEARARLQKQIQMLTLARSAE